VSFEIQIAHPLSIAGTDAMELYQLRTFVSVAREGNLSRAATKLFTSQPAVSAQIKALEDTLGLLLFERTPKGMSLTPAGNTLFQEAEKALAAAQGLLQQAYRLRGEIEGSLRLGTVSNPLTLRLGEFLSLLATHHPKLNIQLTQGTSGTVAQGVLKGDLDAGYVIGEIDEPLMHQRLAPIRLVIAIPAASIEGVQPGDWESIAALPWIGTPESCSLNRLSQDLFKRMGSAPTEIVRADQESTLLELVRQGLGVTLLRENQAREDEATGRCKIWDGAHIDTYLQFVFRKDRLRDPLIESLHNIVRELWQPS
jgi:DNA-binding transcriptional LysR family regulator